MTPPKWVPALSTIGGWLLAALVVIVVLVGVSKLLCRKPPQPVHVSPVKPGVDTLVLHDTTPGQVRVVVDRDSLIALEKMLADAQRGQTFWIRVHRQDSIAIIKLDSAWRAKYDSMWGMTSVQYQRGKLTVQQYHAGIASVKVLRTWRNTWQLTTPPEFGLDLKDRKLPFDFGVELSGTAWTIYDSLAPSYTVRAAFTVRHGTWTWWLGPQVGPSSLRPVIATGVRIGHEF